jgi:N-acetylglucosaminyldiphosphoundecaprenol N-acetyl-beta-D-mannosaminyltransferase
MDVRPGLIGLHKLRRQTNIAFEPEFKTDAEYVETAGLKTDLGLVARYVTTAWAGDEVTEFQPELDILGVRVNNLTMPEAIDWIVSAGESDLPRRLCFVNADCMNLTFKNPAYAKALLSADQVLADGIGLKLAGKLLKKPIIQNVNGTDLFPRLCERVAKTEHSIFLLGGMEGVADGVADWIRRNHPEAKIAGVRHGFFKPEELPAIRTEIKDSGATILLVAFGAPKQDLWIQEQLPDLGPKVAMGVGGLFDFYSERIARAPQWMREMGLEWLFRLIQEPGRMWKRYLVGNAVFVSRVLRYRKSGRSLC